MPTSDPGSPQRTAHVVEAADAAKNEASRMRVISPVPGNGHNSTAAGARSRNSSAAIAWIPARTSSNRHTGAPIRMRPIAPPS